MNHKRKQSRRGLFGLFRPARSPETPTPDRTAQRSTNQPSQRRMSREFGSALTQHGGPDMRRFFARLASQRPASRLRPARTATGWRRWRVPLGRSAGRVGAYDGES